MKQIIFHKPPATTPKDGAGSSSARGKDDTKKDDGAVPASNNANQQQQQQQQDWSILWSCFENPLSLLSSADGLPKGMQDMVCNAVVEMRRYYSRKVIDVLIKVIRATLDTIRKRFHNDDDTGVASAAVVVAKRPIFVLSATLMIPQITIKPTLEELQEHLITVGKNITGIAKGVAQWSSGKDNMQVIDIIIPLIFNE